MYFNDNCIELQRSFRSLRPLDRRANEIVRYRLCWWINIAKERYRGFDVKESSVRGFREDSTIDIIPSFSFFFLFFFFRSPNCILSRWITTNPTLIFPRFLWIASPTLGLWLVHSTICEHCDWFWDKWTNKTYLPCFLHHDVITMPVPHPQDISGHTVPCTGECKLLHGLWQTKQTESNYQLCFLISELITTLQ